MFVNTTIWNTNCICIARYYFIICNSVGFSPISYDTTYVQIFGSTEQKIEQCAVSRTRVDPGILVLFFFYIVQL